jgi:hypothetical protein
MNDGTTWYRVRLHPAFHPEAEISISFGPTGDVVSVTSQGHSVDAPIPVERGLAFLDELAALDPLGIPPGYEGGIDGIQLNCDIQQSNGTWSFSAWSPSPRHHPRQHGFVSAVLGLASDVTREPATARLLVLLSSYLH